jgi:RimJ/RimL family protein N-acetyltransferase
LDEIKTRRLAIRRLTLSDDEFVLRLVNQESFLNFIGDKGVRSLADARDYLRDGPLASYAKHGFGLLLVAEKSSGEPIGICGLLNRDEQPHPDIGFALLPEYESMGYAFESAEAVIEYGFTRLQIKTIVAFVKPENKRSIRLLGRLGLRSAGQAKLAGIGSLQSLYSINN